MKKDVLVLMIFKHGNTYLKYTLHVVLFGAFIFSQ